MAPSGPDMPFSLCLFPVMSHSSCPTESNLLYFLGLGERNHISHAAVWGNNRACVGRWVDMGESKEKGTGHRTACLVHAHLVKTWVSKSNKFIPFPPLKKVLGWVACKIDSEYFHSAIIQDTQITDTKDSMNTGRGIKEEKKKKVKEADSVKS